MIPLPWLGAAAVAVCPAHAEADSPDDHDRPERLPAPNVADPRVAVPTAYFKKTESPLSHFLKYKKRERKEG